MTSSESGLNLNFAHLEARGSMILENKKNEGLSKSVGPIVQRSKHNVHHYELVKMFLLAAQSLRLNSL